MSLKRTCDRCGAQRDGASLPSGWSSVIVADKDTESRAAMETKKDLCNVCTTAHQKFLAPYVPAPAEV